ncbi:MAG: molecular chaperone TorD family protein [Eggerthella lenta]
MSAPTDPAGESVALEALLLARARLYALFHKLFGAAPDAAAIEALLGEATADAVDEYAEDDETMRGFGRFLSELAAVEGRAALLEAARDEYVRLLVRRALPAIPWEAPYRTGEPTVFQEGTLAVRAAYRARGVQPKKLQRVPDDHVALECAFMALEARRSLAQLIACDVRALAAGLRAQQSFAVEHMAGWLGEYAKGLRRSATAVLYPQAAEALAAFVALDATFLAEAALWAEEVSASGEKFEALGAVAGSPEAQMFAAAEEALAALEQTRPFGIEDYELAACEG